MKPKIAILIPAFGDLGILQQCLDHLRNQTRLPDEILILDNGLTKKPDFTNSPLRPLIKTLVFEKNLLYSQALNRAYDESKSDILLFLNSDVLLKPSYLKILSQTFSEKKAICAYGPIYKEDGTLDSSGLKPGLTLKPVDTLKPSESRGPAGAAFAIKKWVCKKLIEQDGFLWDPRMSFFYADLDFSFRLHSLNIRPYYMKEAEAVHLRAASTPRSDSIFPWAFCRLRTDFKALHIRNRRAFLNKWFHLKKHFFLIPFIETYNAACLFLYLVDQCRTLFLKRMTFSFHENIPVNS